MSIPIIKYFLYFDPLILMHFDWNEKKLPISQLALSLREYLHKLMVLKDYADDSLETEILSTFKDLIVSKQPLILNEC